MHLLESNDQKPKRGFAGNGISVVFHMAVVSLAIYATAEARPVVKNEVIEKISYVEAPPATPVEVKTAAPKAPAKTNLIVPVPAKVLQAPIAIPTEIPEIDITAKIVDEKDFGRSGVAAGLPNGVEGGLGDGSGVGSGSPKSGIYSEDQVEEVAVAIGKIVPVYPEAMRAAGIEGQVLAQFVVNEQGRADPKSFKIVTSANPMFDLAVRNALPRMRFKPAKVGGKAVKQLVQQSFQFKLGTA